MSVPDNSHDRSEKEIFFAALEQPSADARAIFLAGACGKNPALRLRIEQLLAEHFEQDEVMKTAAVDGITALEETPISEGPGSSIGRYKLLQKVGEGGMGVVYMAEQTGPVARKVALKIIKLGMDTKQVIARFEAERQALAMMNHPNIATMNYGPATIAPAACVSSRSQGAKAESAVTNPAKREELPLWGGRRPASGKQSRHDERVGKRQLHCVAQPHSKPWRNHLSQTTSQAFRHHSGSWVANPSGIST